MHYLFRVGRIIRSFRATAEFDKDVACVLVLELKTLQEEYQCEEEADRKKFGGTTEFW
jgi:hypothetical protein